MSLTSFKTYRRNMSEFSATLAPNIKKFSELLATLFPTLKKEARNTVPHPGAPSPPIEIIKSFESGSFFLTLEVQQFVKAIRVNHSQCILIERSVLPWSFLTFLQIRAKVFVDVIDFSNFNPIDVIVA